MIYFNPILWLKFRFLILCFDKQIYYFLILYETQIINNLLSFFWKYIHIFWYFYWFFFCWWVSLWIILRWILCSFISDLITNQITVVASAVFSNAFFGEVLGASVTNCLASRSFWLYLPLKFLLIFLPLFAVILLAKGKNS